MQRRFRHTYPVRFDDCNLYNLLTPAAALRYMQDIAGRDSAELDQPGDNGWLAKRTVVRFNSPVKVNTDLVTETYSRGFSKVTAQRAYDLYPAEDETNGPAISGHTLWVYVDGRGRPSRIPENLWRFWLPDGQIAPQADPPWEPLPTSKPHVHSLKVGFSNLDQWGHVNNTDYLELLDDAAWEALAEHGFSPTGSTHTLLPLSYDIEYFESAVFGDKLEISTWFEPSPAEAEEFERIQRITRGEVEITRARSRWRLASTSELEN